MNKSIFLGFPLLLIMGFIGIACIPIEEIHPAYVQDGQRLVVPDWSSVETLIALNAPLAGVAEKRAYNMWVRNPKIPDEVPDVGMRSQPNYELVASIKPTMIINTHFFQKMLPTIFNSIPTKEVNFSDTTGSSWEKIVSSTRELGNVIGHPERAEELIEQTERYLEYQKNRVASLRDRPIALVQFIDARSLRIFGKNNLYGVVIEKLDLKNVWGGDTDTWGFGTISLPDLAKFPKDTMFVIIKPAPVNIREKLDHSAVWQHLAVSQPENHRVVAAAWFFGGLPSVQNFSTNVVAALTENKQENW
ncbi:iron-siderophore ABC transporter substrate-binding protein [Pectobacterium cacticida]|uniref:iron-siderophore ABC transporter substrate-binding protein n=1 Tax=Pectobacterium cacticida TaxID=69221 RepID=UPI00398793ED